MEHPDVAWSPPPQLPSASDLRQAVAILTPATTTREHAMFCIAKLALAFGEGKLSAEATKLRAEVWLEACGDLGNDLWSKATIGLIRSWRRDAHYGRTPEPADFRDAVATELNDRAKKLDRCRRMLEAIGDASPKPAAPVFVPEADRLRKILAKQRAEPGVPEADRLFNTANTERALAFAERRPMESWAAEFFEARSPAGGIAAVTRAVVRDTTRAMERAAVPADKPDAWQAGERVYNKPEEPPPPTEIPEADVEIEP